MPPEDLSDEYVARLLETEAKRLAEGSSADRERARKSSAVGNNRFLLEGLTGRAPKPNTRFLQNIVRDVSSHNAALRAKEEDAARKFRRDLRGGEGPSSARRNRDDDTEGTEEPHSRRRRDSSERRSVKRARHADAGESPRKRRKRRDESDERAKRRRDISDNSDSDHERQHRRSHRERERASRDDDHRRRRRESESKRTRGSDHSSPSRQKRRDRESHKHRHDRSPSSDYNRRSRHDYSEERERYSRRDERGIRSRRRSHRDDRERRRHHNGDHERRSRDDRRSRRERNDQDSPDDYYNNERVVRWMSEQPDGNYAETGSDRQSYDGSRDGKGQRLRDIDEEPEKAPQSANRKSAARPDRSEGSVAKHNHSGGASSPEDRKKASGRPNSTRLHRPSPSSSGSSDPLEAIIGPKPAPPREAVRVRGRAAHRASGIERRFSTSYDPTADVEPDPEEEEDWAAALEALRDRQRWRESGAQRLRDAGFTEAEVGRWEKSGSRPAGGEEGSVADVKWKSKGEGRDWDRGKVLGSEGEVLVQPEADWARLK